MKYYILILLFLNLCACAHQTPHDYCLKNFEHYSSYDECYSERSEKIQNFNYAMSHMGSGLQRPARQNVSCVTTGGPGMYSTNCN